MKYTKQMMKMMEELRNEGLEVSSNGVGFTVNGYYVENGSTISIYKKANLQDMELATSYKTPKSALKFLKGGK